MAQVKLDADAYTCYPVSMTPDATTTALWIGLIRSASRIQAAIETALQAADLPPLGWYDALWEIEKAGELRPLVLQNRLLLPQYALSRLVDRLEKAGLVVKRACDEDGRGHVLSLTEKGREVRGRMWPVYAAVLVGELQERLAPQTAQALAEGLGQLARRSAPDPG
jgi:DNA-binding MarR family transcriptional regulator